ncbi:MAG: M24 family metallopeptidase [Armatimonadota bacterium]
MAAKSEFGEKRRRVLGLLDAGGYDAMLLGRVDNFAWYTCGGQCHVNTAQETGVGALLIHRDRKTLITNNVERPRLMAEEVANQGYGEEVSLWTEDALAPAVARIAPGERIVADVDLPGVIARPDAIAKLRASLTDSEVTRYRLLGAEVGAALGQACLDIEPGMTEHAVAAAIARRHWERGIVPIVVLVAADDRLLKYRHPIPTANQVKRTVMLVVCGRRQGLIVSATRIVNFGPLSAELRAKHDAVVRVDAAFIVNTKTEVRIGDIFDDGLTAYAAAGYPDEWKLHHQGGPTGYAPRDYRATSSSEDPVEVNQAFAWNPSIAGTKSEDTIIALPGGPEIISASPGFPTIEVAIARTSISRPDILVR